MANAAISDPVTSGETRFSYACSGCGGCCRGTRIQLNPYETARLARRLGESVEGFRVGWTRDGVALQQGEDGGCVFLGAAGCTVYSDRPLVCRLYPLGRHIDETGHVRYSRAGGIPGPQGAFGETGTVQAFLQSQGAADFIAAADGYFNWYCKATQAVDSAAAGEGEGADETYDDLLNLDAVVDAYCARTGQEAPGSLEGRMALHLQRLHALLSPKETPHAS